MGKLSNGDAKRLRKGRRGEVGVAAAALIGLATGGRPAAAAAKYGFIGDGTTSTGQTWNAAVNWTLVSGTGTGGPPPTASDTAEFDSTDDKNLAGATIDTGANQSVLQLVLGESGRAINQSVKIANNTITLGAAATGTSPTTLSRFGVGVQTIASNVLLGATYQTWNLANSNANTPGSVTVTGVVGEVNAGSGISKQGAGTLQLNGADTFSGVYATRGGITVVGNNAALGSNAATLVSDPSTSSDASLLTASGITLPQNVTVLSGSGKAATLGGNTTQTTSTWSGTVTLNQAVNLTGGTAGTVTFNGPLVNGLGGTSPTGTQYQFANSNVAITGGTVVLAAVNTYSGTTTVSAGTLRVANTSGSGTGSGTVTVSSGGTLAGTGAMAGNVVVSSGSTITAGSGETAGDSTGVLTSASTHTWTSGSTYTVKIDASSASSGVAAGSGASGAAGVASDELVFSGLTSSSGIAISPVFITATAGSLINGQYSFVIADDRTGATNSSATVFDGLTLGTQITVPTSSAGTYALSTKSDGNGGEDLILDFNSTAAAPEPTSLLLAGAAVPLLLVQRRRAGHR